MRPFPFTAATNLQAALLILLNWSPLVVAGWEIVQTMPVLEFLAGSISGKKERKWKNFIVRYVYFHICGLVTIPFLSQVLWAWQSDTLSTLWRCTLTLVHALKCITWSDRSHFICRCDCRPSRHIKGYSTVCRKHTLRKGWVLCCLQLCHYQDKNTRPEALIHASLSVCHFSCGDSSRAWRSHCWPQARSIQLSSALTVKP